MKRLPVDLDVPVACSLAAADVPARVELLGRLRDAATAVERTGDGMVLHFPGAAEVEADARRFATDEQRCCPFWAFEVTTGSGGIVLRWEGPPAAAEVLDRLHTHLAGDAPIGDLAGLL